MITNDTNFVLGACCREAGACAVHSRSMCNRLIRYMVGVFDILARFVASLGTAYRVNNEIEGVFRCLTPFYAIY